MPTTAQEAAASESNGAQLTAAEKSRLSELQSQIYETEMRSNAPNPEGSYGGSEQRRQAFEAQRQQYKTQLNQLKTEFESLNARASPELQAAISEGGKRSSFQSNAIAVREYGGNFFESGQYQFSANPEKRKVEEGLAELSAYYPYATPKQILSFYNREESESELAKQDAERANTFGEYSTPRETRGFATRPPTPQNVTVNYEATLAARQAGFNVGSALYNDLPETFQKDENKRFAEHNKFIGLTEGYVPPKPTSPPNVSAPEPQNPRPHILTGQPPSEYAAPGFAQKGSAERQGIKPKEINLVENINAFTGKPLSSEAPRTENLSATLFNVAPKKPRNLTQEQVNALSPAAYAEYRKEFENYEQYVNYAKELNRQSIIANRVIWESNREKFSKYISEAKAAGIQYINIETKSGVQTVPIDQALRKKGVIGISAVPRIPEGFTAGYIAGELIAIPEGRQFVGPEKPIQPDYLKNFGTLIGAEALSSEKVLPKYHSEPGRVTSNEKLVASKQVSVLGLQNIKSPYEKANDFVEGLGTGLERFSLDITNVAPEVVIRRDIFGNKNAEQDVFMEHEKLLKSRGVGPSVIPSIMTGEPTNRSVFYNVGELTGEVIPFVYSLGEGMFRNPFSRSPIKPKVPQTEAPEIAKTPTKTLNDLYREPLKLETPEQSILRQAKRERIVQARVKELAELGAEKVAIRFNPKTEKIDYQISQVPLGEGSGFITKGKPEPRFSISGEAPESTQFKELQKKNILENEKKGELSDVLSSNTMNRLTPKESEFKVVSEKEVNELKELQKKNILENEKKGELSDVLSSNTMNRLTPKESEFKAITEREVNELKELKRRRTEPSFLETNVEIGRGAPNILRISGGKITETPKGGPFTFIEKVANLRKNPELEEREPLKFYIKKELGYPESEPIDMTGRIDLGFEKVELGHGGGFITKGKPEPRFSISGEAPESTQFKELQKKNLLENEKKGELSDILSSDTMNRLTPKESPFKVVSEKEVNELKELQKKNILEKKKPELLLKAKEEHESAPLKIDLRKQIQEDLFKKAGFKKIATVNLGEGKGEVIAMAGAGAGAVAPLPLVIAETEDEKNNPITNATETNGTITNGTIQLPPIINPNLPAETSTVQQPSSSIFAAAQITPTGLAYGLEAVKARRTRAQQMLERKPIQKEKQAFLVINPTKESSKNKTFMGFAQPQGLKQPQRLNSIFPTPQMPAVKLVPISLQTEKQKQKQTTKEPPGFNFKFTKPRESRKEKARKDKLDAFVGNVSDVDIALGFNRKEITPGIKASEKRYKKDILFAYKRAGFKKLITQHEGSVLSKKKRSILEREKPKEVKKQKRKTGGFF